MAKRRQSIASWVFFFLIFGGMGGFVLYAGINSFVHACRSTKNLQVLEAQVLDASDSNVRVGFILEGIPTEYLLNPAPLGVKNNDMIELVIEDFNIESYDDTDTGKTEYFISNISAYSPKGTRQLGLFIIGFGGIFFAFGVFAIVMIIKTLKHNRLFKHGVECNGVVRDVIPTSMSVSSNNGPSRRICIFHITYVDEFGQYHHFVQKEAENNAQAGFLVKVFHAPNLPSEAYADLTTLPSADEAQRFQEAHPNLMDIPFPDELVKQGEQNAAASSVRFLMIFLIVGIIMTIFGFIALMKNGSSENGDISSPLVVLVMGIGFTLIAIFAILKAKKK